MRKRQKRKPHMTQRQKARSVGGAVSIEPVPGSLAWGGCCQQLQSDNCQRAYG